jgi:hypothetical protein
MKIALTTATGVALALAGASSAFAATGTVDVTGNVAALCSATSFSDTIALNELADTSTGRLDTNLTGAGGAPNLTKSFAVVCTSAAPTVTVKATQLTNVTNTATPANGYTSTINYTATARAHLAAGGTATPVVYDTTGTPAATSVQLAGPLANPGSGTNLDVTLSNAQTVVSTDILTAGAYKGQITVTVEPTA